MKFLFWNIKKRDPRANHVFTDEDRSISEEMRRIKVETAKEKSRLELDLMRLRAERERLVLQDEIQEMQSNLESYLPEEETGDSSETLLLTLLTSILTKGKLQDPLSQPATISAVSPSPQPVAGVSEDQIRSIWNNLPRRIQKTAKKMTDEDLRTIIISKMPNIDAESIQKAIQIIRE